MITTCIIILLGLLVPALAGAVLDGSAAGHVRSRDLADRERAMS